MKYGSGMKRTSAMKKAAEKARAENRKRMNGPRPQEKTKK